MHIKQNIL